MSNNFTDEPPTLQEALHDAKLAVYYCVHPFSTDIQPLKNKYNVYDDMQLTYYILDYCKHLAEKENINEAIKEEIC